MHTVRTKFEFTNEMWDMYRDFLKESEIRAILKEGAVDKLHAVYYECVDLYAQQKEENKKKARAKRRRERNKQLKLKKEQEEREYERKIYGY